MSARWVALGVCLATLLLPWTVVGAQTLPPVAAPEGRITYHADVAPLIAAQCTSCHTTGGGAPFTLTSYRDVRRRARQIVEVTASGFMPPWLPRSGAKVFRGARGLSADGRALLAQWVAQGTIEGEASATVADGSAKGAFGSGAKEPPKSWPLGEPDFTVASREPFTVPAEGLGLIRTLVLPLPTPGQARQPVRAVAFRTNNAAALHGALFLADATGLASSLDAATPAPGYAAMGSIGLNVIGSLGGWNIGSPMHPWPDGYAWSAPVGDISVQLHLNPTGKAEEVDVQLGFYHVKDPAPRPVTSVVLSSLSLDIPAGAADYRTTADYTVPVDSELLGLLPVAHLICKSIEVRLDTPDGATRSLIQIDDWDMNWQQPYQYVTPIPLPKGSRVEMEYHYDNSAGNPRNPFAPPRRVTPGQAPQGEVGILLLQVSPKDAANLATVEESSRNNFRRALLERDRK